MEPQYNETIVELALGKGQDKWNDISRCRRRSYFSTYLTSAQDEGFTVWQIAECTISSGFLKRVHSLIGVGEGVGGKSKYGFASLTINTAAEITGLLPRGCDTDGTHEVGRPIGSHLLCTQPELYARSCTVHDTVRLNSSPSPLLDRGNTEASHFSPRRAAAVFA
ncbi:uncharacterized protein EI90DRAFT_3104401 [Cantharellus anzutake]|uniref:uncharacterized protein n=1 Tax=Cantharellus anzutake TaxID=1750568 RepID=UPI001907FA28|nr:uncharacterized protein EI90DRAFT_3104401 [Cantharellus anzutake]KAF8309695.1 hypothetical protein EI90DRAFT_3104401 [Cantharellus anzutake]